MNEDKRCSERIVVKEFATLTSPFHDNIGAAVNNISLGGLLISTSPLPLNKTTRYKIKIASTCIKPSIILSGKLAWKKGLQHGFKISHYHVNSKELLDALIIDIKETNQLIERLQGNWLDDQFVDNQGKVVDVEYI